MPLPVVAFLLPRGSVSEAMLAKDAFAVQTKGQADKISLAGFMREAIVGKSVRFIGFRNEDGERLLLVRGVGAKAAVEKHSIAGPSGERATAVGRLLVWRGLAGDFGLRVLPLGSSLEFSE